MSKHQDQVSVYGVRVALCCISSDIPATRKPCGFHGFKAKHGCSKCMKEFVTTSFSESTDYSGFERVMATLKLKNSSSEGYRGKERSIECCKNRNWTWSWSTILWAATPTISWHRCHIIDPMHNLLLGTAKNIHFGKLPKSFQKAHSHQFRTLLILYLFLPGLGDYLRK